jgi:GNAT superfamily N-acetyltransferase
MPEFSVSLETLRKHRYIDAAIEDGVKLFEAGGIELTQDDPKYFRCIVPIPGKEHKSVALTYTDDRCDLEDFYCGCTHFTKRHGLLCRHVVAAVLAVQGRVITDSPRVRPKPTFRTASRGDGQRILDFIKELAKYEEMLADVTATPELIERWLFDKRAAEAIFAVADGKEVGFALYFTNFSTFLGKAGLYLEDLFVMPGYRGRGIGKALLRELARITAERGYGRMEWACLDWNEPGIDFYRSLGAVDLPDRTTYRLEGEAFNRLAELEGKDAVQKQNQSHV